jgi:hypothetical protein
MRLLTTVALALSTLLAAPAWAEPNCQPVEQMKAYLASKYGESQVASGISSDQTLVMIFTKPDNSTFTVVKVTANGLACMVDVGQDWQLRQPEPEGEAS